MREYPVHLEHAQLAGVDGRVGGVALRVDADVGVRRNLLLLECQVLPELRALQLQEARDRAEHRPLPCGLLSGA